MARQYANQFKRSSPESKLLAKWRGEYSFRLVREHSARPDPKEIQASGSFGDFARSPRSDGDEWLFKTKEARDKFLAEYGGTQLGPQ